MTARATELAGSGIDHRPEYRGIGRHELGCRRESAIGIICHFSPPSPKTILSGDPHQPEASQQDISASEPHHRALVVEDDDNERELLAGFLPADGLLSAVRGGARARLLTPSREVDRTAVVLGCDPALGILRAHVERRNRDVRLLWLPTASRGALEQLRAGRAHVAGTHLSDPATGVHNLPYAKAALSTSGGILVRFASWMLRLRAGPATPRP